MPLYNPVNVPVTGPQGLNQWDLGVPDLGGGAMVQMAGQIMKSMDKASENVGSILQQRQGASYLLGAMASAKVPGTNQPMFDSEMMNKLAKGPLAAQQQFIGTALTTYTQAQQQMAEQTAQQRLLQMYQQQPGLLNTKLLMQESPGQRPPMGNAAPRGIQITQNPGTPATYQQTPAAEQTKNAPKFTAPPGYSWDIQKYNGNDVHVLYDPNNKIAGIYNTDNGSLYGR